MNCEITSRERVRLALQHKKTDRVPLSLGFGVNEPAKVKLMSHLGMKRLADVNDWLASFSDTRWISAEYCGPSDREKRWPDGTYVDYWNIVRKPVSYGEGFYDEIIVYPLGDVNDISELDNYMWPSTDWFDTGDLHDRIDRLNRDGEKTLILGNGNIFETSWYMRGFEKMFTDFVLDPELAFEIMRRVTEYYISYFTKILSAADGRIDIAFTADDIAHQTGLFMSVSMWEEMIKPHHVRLNKVLHEFGVKVMYHSDGAVTEAVPGLINMGVDVLEALQFDAVGMDPVRLKEAYGDRLCFHGGVSVQSTLPFGTPEQVKEEVGERIRVLGKNGGYILAPSHAIQAGTPPKNIVAFLEAAGNKMF